MDTFVTMPMRISADLAERIDEYWHTRRLTSRAVAIRELLERGLSRPPQRSQADIASSQENIEQQKDQYQGENNLNDQGEWRRQG
jgi:metal-responsive CopG/Arc/MetJ family transcriptional regulator